jgi:ABC-type glycerol-3-phosphate transport system substrate-binding protein
MMIRTLIAALPLVLVLSGCGGSVTAPREAETTTEVSYSSGTAVADTVRSDSTSRTGGTMGSGN